MVQNEWDHIFQSPQGLEKVQQKKIVLKKMHVLRILFDVINLWLNKKSRSKWSITQLYNAY